MTRRDIHDIACWYGTIPYNTMQYNTVWRNRISNLFDTVPLRIREYIMKKHQLYTFLVYKVGNQ